ncbi:MAG: TetR/AcrR family transcriptional regulator [Lachnospiraceae bacterium]|nr:TetR/AcrR family transcriptional regulator [Lachnospiraceae bacterium]
MRDDKQTKKKLTDCAKKEFIEKGYMKASLRNICKNAGVTTGAMYFFFKDKEELFESVVGGPLLLLEQTIGSHFSSEQDQMAESSGILPGNLEDDYASAMEILSVLFRYKEEYLLLIGKAQGSRYEDIVDRFVASIYQHYLEMYCKMKGYSSLRNMTAEDKFVVHWMSHDQIDIFIHLLTHCKSEKEAKKQMKNMFNYMVGGWISTIRKQPIP